MLITQLKSKETIRSLVDGKKVFIINCHGCKEVSFPEAEALELVKELEIAGISLIRTTYNEDYEFAVIQSQPCDPNVLGLISDFLLG